MADTSERWYRLSIVWLGIAVFVASLGGCIAVIVLASRYADEPLPVAEERLLKVPAVRNSEAAPQAAPVASQK